MGQISVKTITDKEYFDKMLCMADKNYLFEKYRVGDEIKQEKLNHIILITQILCK
jgi:hypothetical protein